MSCASRPRHPSPAAPRPRGLPRQRGAALPAPASPRLSRAQVQPSKLVWTCREGDTEKHISTLTLTNNSARVRPTERLPRGRLRAAPPRAQPSAPSWAKGDARRGRVAHVAPRPITPFSARARLSAGRLLQDQNHEPQALLRFARDGQVWHGGRGFVRRLTPLATWPPLSARRCAPVAGSTLMA